MSLLCKLGSHNWVTKEIINVYSFACTKCSKTKPETNKVVKK
ncbi:DUF1660 family phage protein [Chloroflexota bacterium]